MDNLRFCLFMELIVVSERWPFESMSFFQKVVESSLLVLVFEDDDGISKLITPKMSRASVARTSSKVGILLIVDII